MPDNFYLDILIEDEDIKLDAGKQPHLVNARSCIAQDLKHMIIESGLLVEMIGERDRNKRKTSIVRITLMVDGDYRIKPGTSRIEEHWIGSNFLELYLTAETLRYGKISFIIYSGQVGEKDA